jgi:hypothetical protein
MIPEKNVVTVAAWLEVVVGASLVVAPDVPYRLLFAVIPEGVAIPLARFVGVALVALGISCLPSNAKGPRRSAVLGLLVFNCGATIIFTWVAVATPFRGFLVWPTVVLHAAIAAALLSQFLTRSALRT